MEKYKDMVDAVEVMPHLCNVEQFHMDAIWFAFIDKLGNYRALIDVRDVSHKTDAFDHLIHYSVERMKREQAEIFKVTT